MTRNESRKRGGASAYISVNGGRRSVGNNTTVTGHNARIYTARDLDATGLHQFSEVPGRQGNITSPSVALSNTHERQGGEASRTNEENSSQGARSIKVKPFPADVKPGDKLFKWKYWLSTLELALEHHGITDQRKMAIQLTLFAGEEIGVIIMTKDLMPRKNSVPHDYKFFDHLVEGITKFFGQLTDANTNAREFKNMKQKEGESARAFALRTEMAAQKIGLTNASLITANFVDGLRDKELRRWADSFTMSLEDTVRAATVRENDPDNNEFPWSKVDSSATPVTVAAVEKRERRPDSADARVKKEHVTGHKQERSHERGTRPDKRRNESSKCAACNSYSHNGRRCPAENARCHECNEVGHFRAACNKKRVRYVEKNKFFD